MYKKHSIKLSVSILVIVFLSFSCVSTKKYDEALTSIARMKKDSTVAANQIATAKYNKATEVAAMKSQVDNQQQQLDSLKLALLKRQSTLQSVKNALMDAFPNLTEFDVSTRLENGHVFFALDHRVLFNRGEQSITSDGKKILSKVGSILKDAESDIMVLGHTDSIPYHTEKYDNWMLSMERAHSVAEILVEFGVDPQRLIIAGKGQYEPEFDNAHQIGQLLNRRIELVLLPDMQKVEDLFADHISK
jgi:chemotaxis protein MotB